MTTPSKPSPAPWRWAGLSGDLVAANDQAVMTDGRPFLEVDAALIARAPEMAAMLRELEWAGAEDYPDAGARRCCPLCRKFYLRPERGMPDALHTPDCRLSALLRDLP